MTAPATFKDRCLDANDLRREVDFWTQALGYDAHWVNGPDGPVKLTGAGPTIWVNPVPEPKVVKDRVHLDVTLHGATPDDLVSLGATVIRKPDDDIVWWILADPEGHEFCAFPTEGAP